MARGMLWGPGCRVEAQVPSDPGWPAIGKSAGGARVAGCVAGPQTGVRILGRGVVLAGRVVAAAEDWGADEIVSVNHKQSSMA